MIVTAANMPGSEDTITSFQVPFATCRNWATRLA